MADEKTNRERLAERFRGKNPDFNIDDDEALYGEALSGLERGDELESQRQKLNETIAGNEAAPELLNGLISGKNEDGSDFDLDEYMLDRHIDYLIDYMENKDTAREKYDKRKAEREEQAARDAEFAAKAEELLAAEDKELDAAIEESGYRPEQVKDLIDWIYNSDAGFIRRARDFELKKEDFLRLFKIKDWDLKMSEAEDKGYRRGKNEKIDMFRRDQGRRKRMPPDAGSGGGTPQSGGEQKDPTIAALERMSKY